jgi:hypothetical protein
MTYIFDACDASPIIGYSEEEENQRGRKRERKTRKSNLSLRETFLITWLTDVISNKMQRKNLSEENAQREVVTSISMQSNLCFIGRHTVESSKTTLDRCRMVCENEEEKQNKTNETKSDSITLNEMEKAYCVFEKSHYWSVGLTFF